MVTLYIIEGGTMYHEIIRYMLVGACSTTIDILIFSQLVKSYNFCYQQALCISFIFGVFVNFCLCASFIFVLKSSWWHACLKHYAANVTGLASNQFGMFVLVSLYGMQNLLVARLAVQTITFLINFFLIKSFVFGESSGNGKLSA